MRASGSILVDLALAEGADLGGGCCFGLFLLANGHCLVHSLNDEEKNKGEKEDNKNEDKDSSNTDEKAEEK